MNPSISRRTFVGHTALLSLGAVWTSRWERAVVPPILRIGLLVDSASTTIVARRNGATLGIEEAQRAAAMFGQEVELVEGSATLNRSDLTALIGGEDPMRCAHAARSIAKAGGLFFNVACASDALRGADCSPAMFHVAASDAMLRDARAQAEGSGTPVAWDASLTRFGADTLNQRFARRFGAAMTQHAWAAWVAVKVLWESSVRLRSADSARLAEHLLDDATQFDGHKGRPLSFRPWDHQLRQPLYVRGESGIAEFPASSSGAESSRAALDRLGTSATHTSCRLSP